MIHDPTITMKKKKWSVLRLQLNTPYKVVFIWHVQFFILQKVLVPSALLTPPIVQYTH